MMTELLTSGRRFSEAWSSMGGRINTGRTLARMGYFTGGHFGYNLVGTDGSRSGHSRAAGVFSCWPDGSDVRVEGQGGSTG